MKCKEQKRNAKGAGAESAARNEETPSEAVERHCGEGGASLSPSLSHLVSLFSALCLPWLILHFFVSIFPLSVNFLCPPPLSIPFLFLWLSSCWNLHHMVQNARTRMVLCAPVFGAIYNGLDQLQFLAHVQVKTSHSGHGGKHLLPVTFLKNPNWTRVNHWSEDISWILKYSCHHHLDEKNENFPSCDSVYKDIWHTTHYVCVAWPSVIFHYNNVMLFDLVTLKWHFIFFFSDIKWGTLLVCLENVHRGMSVTFTAKSNLWVKIFKASKLDSSSGAHPRLYWEFLT